MSCRLKEFVRNIRACKTASEERALVAKECALIRTAIKEDNAVYRHRNMTKILFIHLMGYPCQFAQIECFKLIASNSFMDKRIGYLSLYQILDENTETLMLVTNSIKNDLSHSSQYINGLALSALSYIGTVEMCRTLLNQIQDLCSYGNPFVQKKAILCVCRLIRKTDDIADRFVSLIPTYFECRNHGVLLAACSLVETLAGTKDQTIIESMRSVIPNMLIALKRIMSSAEYLCSTEYSVAGISDPFLQTKLIRAIRTLQNNHEDLPSEVACIYSQVLSMNDRVNPTYQIIQLECSNAILDLANPNNKILGEAVNVLSRFLQSSNLSIKYVGINTIQKVAQYDKRYLDKYFQTILNCLKENDISIQNASLDLVTKLVKKTNINLILNQFKDLLTSVINNSSMIDFAITLINKTCLLIENHAPTVEWRIEQTINLMSISKYYFPVNSWKRFIYITSNNGEQCSLVVNKLYDAYKKNPTSFMIVASCLWILGEYNSIAIHQLTADTILKFYQHVLSLIIDNQLMNTYPLLEDLNSLSSTLIVSQAKLLESPLIGESIDMSRLSDLLIMSLAKFARKFTNQPSIFSQVIQIYKEISEAEFIVETKQRCLEMQTLLMELQKHHDYVFDLMPPLPLSTADALIENDSFFIEQNFEPAQKTEDFIFLDAPSKIQEESPKNTNVANLLASIFQTEIYQSENEMPKKTDESLLDSLNTPKFTELASPKNYTNLDYKKSDFVDLCPKKDTAAQNLFNTKSDETFKQSPLAENKSTDVFSFDDYF